ncbi:MAG: hypothetical protein CMC35_06935 [Flavobacteriaceae bacterium]|nr:hypothetical protein [Flavobacteriaceae bacterium]|tara:strand:- start:7538 stop:8719 length:1182 start_codon:yes stop_codon:yes gene_type:complete
MRITTYVCIAFLLSAIVPATAQVGIGTTSPKSILDINASSKESPSSTDGILIPRVDDFPATDPGKDQDGMMVFLTTAVGTYDKGFYYWDNTQLRWINLGAEEWKDGINPSGSDYIYATQARLSGTDVVITDDGRIGFGTDDPVERFEFRGPGDNDFQITSANTNPPNYILYNTGGTLDMPDLLATDQEVGSLVVKTHDGSSVQEVGGFRFYMDGTPTGTSLPTRFTISNTPSGQKSQVERLIIRQNGNTGLSESNPTATLHIRSGAAAAQSAPLKFTSGTNLTTPEAGAVEYDGTHLYFTAATSRKILLKGLTATATLDFPNIAVNGSAELTVTVPGATTGSSCNCAPNASVEAGLFWNCYISAANTVTIRVANNRAAAVNPASKSWKVTVVE